MHILHVGRNQAEGYFYYVMELADDASAECGIETEEYTHGAQRLSPHSALRTPQSYTPKTLRSEIERHGRLPLAQCVEIGLGLCTALSHLHRHGLVHRDIKPSNIIFVHGRPKLADIGLVTDAGDARSIVGTEGYLAPEGPGSPQADLYSLGTVLYEISTGRDRRHCPDLPPDLRDWPERQVLLELNEVLIKACARDPRERYQSAEEMQTDLAACQSGQSLQRLRIVERRFALAKRVGLVGAAVLVVAAAGLLYQQSQTRGIKREKRVAEQLLYAADMSLAQQALDAGNLVRATTLLEAHRPQRGREDFRGFEWYYLKNLCRGDEAHTFQGHEQGVKGVAISPNGKLLASGGDDGTIRLWDFLAKTSLAVLLGHAGPVNAVAFSPDGTKLASGGEDKTAKVWDLATQKILSNFTNHSGEVTSVAFSPDGERLAVGILGTTAKLWHVATERELKAFEAPDGGANFVAFSPDGSWFALAGDGFQLRLWDLATLQPVDELYDEAGSTWGIAFSPDSKILATTRSDGIYLWDLASRPRHVTRKLRGHEGEVHPVVFSPDGKTVASGSIDSTVRLWDVASHQQLRILKGHKDWVCSIAFSPDGQTLVSASMDHTVRLWELSPKADPNVLRGHTDSVQSVAFSPDDKLLASASFDGTVKLWDVVSGTNLHTFTGHTGIVTGVIFSADGSTLYSCSLDQTIRLWNVRTREPERVLPGPARMASLALSPDERILACGSGWWDQTDSPSEVSFWDVRSFQLLTNMIGPSGMVRTMTFVDKGQTLAVGLGGDTSLELIDVASRRVTFASTNLHAEMTCSPDTETLAVSDEAYPIALFDTHTRQIVRRLQMSGIATRCMAFTPDGSTLAIWYTTPKIKLCNVATGREVATLERHTAFGMHLTFSHDGQTLATASNDRTIRLWRAPRQ